MSETKVLAAELNKKSLPQRLKQYAPYYVLLLPPRHSFCFWYCHALLSMAF